MTQTHPTRATNGPTEGDVAVKKRIYETIERLNVPLRTLNRKIHDTPEVCYKEFQAHSTITAFLKAQNVSVVPHAYGLKTSFSAEYGSGGRVIAFCAEYDALPEIGHACGHNLIATASVAAFLGVVAAVKKSKAPGRVRILGTPAEEGGGGKIKLIEAGAFKNVDAALMVHPGPPAMAEGAAGIAYGTCLAATTASAHFTGKAAHAGAAPWMGVNAMDAATLAYTTVGMLRQQCRPTDRINIVVKGGDSAINVITENAEVEFGIRCKTITEVDLLRDRVEKCMEGAGIATGCSVQIRDGMPPYAELRPNEALCLQFTKAMSKLGSHFKCDFKNIDQGGYGTDMGNVSHVVPSFHGMFAIPARPEENIHGPGFTRATGTDEAHSLALEMGKGLGVVGWKFLVDDEMARQVRDDFENDKLKRLMKP